MTRRSKSVDGLKKSLFETIARFKDPVTPDRLFLAAGYDSDSVADVESFYLALREELNVRIRRVGSDDSNLLEAIPDAS